MASGVCARTDYADFFDCESSAQGAWPLGTHSNISSIEDCVRTCRLCRQCAFVAFSHKWQECGWFSSCEQPLTEGAAADFSLVRVRQPRLPAARERREMHPCSMPVSGGRRLLGESKARLRGRSVDERTTCTTVFDTTDSVRVACVGDSNTRGDAAHEPGDGIEPPWKHELEGRGNYPARLQELLGARYTVANFGRSGATAVELGRAYRIGGERRTQLECFRPRVVLLMIGTNDCIPQKAMPKPGCPAPLSRFRLRDQSLAASCSRAFRVLSAAFERARALLSKLRQCCQDYALRALSRVRTNTDPSPHPFQNALVSGPEPSAFRAALVATLRGLVFQLLGLPSRPDVLLVEPPPARWHLRWVGGQWRRHLFPLRFNPVVPDTAALNWMLPPLLANVSAKMARRGRVRFQSTRQAFRGCPDDVAACCLLLTSDGLHMSAPGADALATLIFRQWELTAS